MKHEDIIKAAVDRMAEAIDADSENRDEALDDLKNLAGFGQWPEDVRAERENEGRPCMTINRLPQFTRQVTGDIRRLNPAINIIPGDNDASDEIAEVYEGIIRQIQYQCDASSIYERAAESAAQCGMGFFRVRADYESDDSFNQEILIEPIGNPFSVYFDPSAKDPTRKDGRYLFITEQMKSEDFGRDYPDAQRMDVVSDGKTDGLENWRTGDAVVVAEYFWKEPVEKDLALLADGSVVENPVAPQYVLKKRKVQTHKVMWAKITGKEVLEGPLEIPSRFIPVVAVMGEELNIGPRVVRTSVIRYAKDPQRLYNYSRSAGAETVALQPKAPYLVTSKQIAGLERFWNDANTANRPYLPYNPDEKAPPPQRSTPPVSSQGQMAEAQLAADDMKATTGIYDAGLGAKSNEKSGIAIQRRQLESDISTSIYTDNLAKAIAQCGRIIVDMIPKVYDTHRTVRTLAKDETQKMVEVNGVAVSIDGVQRVNDLRAGKYSVRVTVGPNHTTRRQEAAESMIDFVRAVPQAGAVTSDLIARNMDWPGADEFAERLRKTLPPGIVSQEDMSPEQQQQQAATMQQQAQIAQMAQVKAQAGLQKDMAEAKEAAADADRAALEVTEKQLELALKSGQLNAAIERIVHENVARALQGAFAPRGAF